MWTSPKLGTPAPHHTLYTPPLCRGSLKTFQAAATSHVHPQLRPQPPPPAPPLPTYTHTPTRLPEPGQAPSRRQALRRAALYAAAAAASPVLWGVAQPQAVAARVAEVRKGVDGERDILMLSSGALETQAHLNETLISE